MQTFQTEKKTRTQFVTKTERLLQFAIVFAPVCAVPFRFKRQIVRRDEPSKIFLRDEFRFQFAMAVACLDFFIDGETNRIGYRVSEVVDELDCGVAVTETRRPIGRAVVRMRRRREPLRRTKKAGLRTVEARREG